MRFTSRQLPSSCQTWVRGDTSVQFHVCCCCLQTPSHVQAVTQASVSVSQHSHTCACHMCCRAKPGPHFSMPTTEQASLRLPESLQLQTAPCTAAAAVLPPLPTAASDAWLRDCHAEARHAIPFWPLLRASRPVVVVFESIHHGAVLLLPATCVVW